MINLSSLTIIINCYNSATYLAETLSNLINSDNYFKIFVVDNCSTDSTRAIANNFASFQTRVSVFSTPTHCSLGEARNFAISLVSTQYFGFVDSDDLVLKNRFSTQLKCMTSLNSPASFTNSFSLDNKYRLTKLPGYGTSVRSLSTTDLLDSYHPSLSSILFDRDFLLNNIRNPIFNPKFSFIEEYDLLLRLSLSSPILYIPDYLTLWRINDKGLTLSSPEKFIEERLFLYQD